MPNEQQNATGEAFSGAEPMYTTEFEGASQYKRPSCYELEGKKLDLVFDDGTSVLVDFWDGQNLVWMKNGTVPEYHKYECIKCTDTIYLVVFERPGRWPREGVSLIIDLGKDLVTGNFLKQGTKPEYVNLVTRDLVFGAIRRPGKPLPTERHCYTKDLIGKKIEYTYSPKFKVIHIYYNDKVCRGTLPKDVLEASLTAQSQSGKPERERKIFEEPSIYLKIAENVYVFSWIERNFKSGTQGFAVMDTARLYHCGFFFGVNPQGKPECYMMSAYGRIVTETLPEESMPSPYTYDD